MTPGSKIASVAILVGVVVLIGYYGLTKRGADGGEPDEMARIQDRADELAPSPPPQLTAANGDPGLTPVDGPGAPTPPADDTGDQTPAATTPPVPLEGFEPDVFVADTDGSESAEAAEPPPGADVLDDFFKPLLVDDGTDPGEDMADAEDAAAVGPPPVTPGDDVQPVDERPRFDDGLPPLAEEDAAAADDDGRPVIGVIEPEPTRDDPTDADEPEVYIVQENDSFWTIAKSKLGSGAKWQLIAKANPMVDPAKIKPGDKLIIPNPMPEMGPVAEKTETDPLGLGLNRDDRTIRALENDSLWKIAEREYGDGTKWRIVYEANRDRLRDEHSVREGQELVIPALRDE